MKKIIFICLCSLIFSETFQKKISSTEFYNLDNGIPNSIDLNQFILGPDFPTGGQIIGKKGIIEAFLTGKGSCVLRSKTSKEKYKHQIND